MVAPSCAYQAARWTVSLILRESSEGLCSRSARNEKDLFETRKSVSSNSITAGQPELLLFGFKRRIPVIAALWGRRDGALQDQDLCCSGVASPQTGERWTGEGEGCLLARAVESRSLTVDRP
jgi:hypothetical protein